MSITRPRDIERIRSRAEARPIDMGPFGGVETFLCDACADRDEGHGP